MRTVAGSDLRRGFRPPGGGPRRGRGPPGPGGGGKRGAPPPGGKKGEKRGEPFSLRPAEKKNLPPSPLFPPLFLVPPCFSLFWGLFRVFPVFRSHLRVLFPDFVSFFLLFFFFIFLGNTPFSFYPPLPLQKHNPYPQTQWVRTGRLQASVRGPSPPPPLFSGLRRGPAFFESRGENRRGPSPSPPVFGSLFTPPFLGVVPFFSFLVCPLFGAFFLSFFLFTPFLHPQPTPQKGVLFQLSSEVQHFSRGRQIGGTFWVCD